MNNSNQNDTHEKEIKLHLKNEEQFQRILEHFGKNGSKRHQKNHFFDTPEKILRNKKMTLRIRQEGGEWFITLKGQNQSKTEVTVRMEIEYPLDPAFGKKIIEDPALLGVYVADHYKAIETKIGDSVSELRFVKILYFENIRHFIEVRKPGHTIILELDQTHYDREKVYYELEMECQNEAFFEEDIRFLRNELQILNIPWEISKLSKFARGLGLIKNRDYL